jgi:hypothetical protein
MKHPHVDFQRLRLVVRLFFRLCAIAQTLFRKHLRFEQTRRDDWPDELLNYDRLQRFHREFADKIFDRIVRNLLQRCDGDHRTAWPRHLFSIADIRSDLFL